MKKYVTLSLLFIISITIAVSVSLYLMSYNPFQSKASGPLSASELVKRTISTEEITTNLADEGFVRVEFQIQLDSEKAKKELEKRIFQLENAVIYELAGTTSKEIQGQDGIKLLEQNIAKRTNEFLNEGKVVRVFTTQKIIQ